MLKGDKENKVMIVEKRLFKGGNFAGIWLVFRKNKLPLRALIVDNDQYCSIEIDGGRVTAFSYHDALGEWFGGEALTRLKALVKKAGVRFSLFVAP